MDRKNIVHETLRSIQKEYKELLLMLRDQLNTENSLAILDNINVFWYKYRTFIKTVVPYFYKPFSSYLFTGAISLNVDAGDQYPFIMLGEYHIFDDPVSSYLNLPKCANRAFNLRMENAIRTTIEMNIKILSDYASQIYVLPLRFLFLENNEELTSVCEDLFWSLFLEPEVIKERWNSFRSVDEISNLLIPNVMESIFLYDNDDTSLKLSERISSYKKGQELPVSKNSTDIELFMLATLSMIQQAIHIIYTSFSFNIVPYIRFIPTFMNVSFFLEQLGVDEVSSEYYSKFLIGHILHYRIDKEKCSLNSFSTFVEIAREVSIQDKILEELSIYGIGRENWHMEKAVQIIDKNLDLFYYHLLK